MQQDGMNDLEARLRAFAERPGSSVTVTPHLVMGDDRVYPTGSYDVTLRRGRAQLRVFMPYPQHQDYAQARAELQTILDWFERGGTLALPLGIIREMKLETL